MSGRSSMLDALASFAKNPFAELRLRLDSWQNEVTGFGTSRDKTTYGTVVPNFRLPDQTLSALYHTDDMAARMVDVVPQEMLREGFSAELGDKQLDADLKSKLDELDVRGKAADGIRWGRAYGGGGVLIGADDGREAALPLIPEYANDVDYLMVLDRRMLWPVEYYTRPGHPKFGRPKTYLVWLQGGPTTVSSVIHETRLVLFPGATTGIQERNQNFSWDYSVLQRAWEALRGFNTGWKSVEVMMTDGNQGVFKMTGLAEMIRSNSLEELQTRMRIIDMYRSVVRALVVDADSPESFERTSASFADIPSTLDKLMLRLSAAVQIPVTILMGQSPAGMSATGDSDFRWFYDRMRAEQTIMLEPRLRRIVEVLLRTKAWSSRAGQRLLNIKFPPLWKPNPQEEAARRLTIAQTDAAYIQAQVITPEEVALSRITPTGFGEDLVMTDAARAARQRVLSEDLDSMKGGAQSDAADTEQDPEPDAQRLDDTDARAARLDARTFVLYRKEDETGVSGTGEVAEGVLFGDGKVAMRWKTNTASTTLFDSIDHVLKVHGHGGKTEIRWIEEPNAASSTT